VTNPTAYLSNRTGSHQSPKSPHMFSPSSCPASLNPIPYFLPSIPLSPFPLASTTFFHPALLPCFALMNSNAVSLTHSINNPIFSKSNVALIIIPFTYFPFLDTKALKNPITKSVPTALPCTLSVTTEYRFNKGSCEISSNKIPSVTNLSVPPPNSYYGSDRYTRLLYPFHPHPLF